jgi:hypothetical protein
MEATLSTTRHTRKFKERSSYENIPDSYYLLPFRFHRMADQREVLINELGDFMVVQEGTAMRIIQKEITVDTEEDRVLYEDLMAGFIISETPVPDLLEVMATRYRTKKSFLDHFTSLHIFVISLRCEHTCHYCQVSRVTCDNGIPGR